VTGINLPLPHDSDKNKGATEIRVIFCLLGQEAV
jgi:hypothetical protein